MLKKIFSFIEKRLFILFFIVTTFSIVTFGMSFAPLEIQKEYSSIFWLADLFVHWQYNYLIFVVISFLILVKKGIFQNFFFLLLSIATFAFPIFWHFPSVNVTPSKEAGIKLIFANIHYEANHLGKIEQIAKEKKVDFIALVETSPSIEASLDAFSKKHNFTLIKDIQLGGFGYSLLVKKGISTKLIGDNKQSMPEDTIVIEGEKFDKKFILNLVHYMPPLSADAKEMRDTAVQKTIKNLNAYSNKALDYNIVLGDMNATIWSTPLNEFRKIGFKSITSYNPTWPSIFGGNLGIGIDHVLIKDNNVVVDKLIFEQENGSDHLGLYMRIVSGK